MKTRQSYFRTKIENEANFSIDNLPLGIVSTGIEYFYAHFKENSYRYDYSLVYVLDGRLNYLIDGRPFNVEKGCFAIIEPLKKLTFTSDKDFNNYYWLQFSGYDAKKLLANLQIKFEKAYNIGVHEDIKKHFSRIFKEFMINDTFFDIAIAALLTELITALSRKAISDNKFSLTSIEYIHKHYNEDISVNYLASLENLSSSYYRTVFKQTMGVTPYDYIISLRINSACFYLGSNNYTIDEIAQIVGYNDQFYFSRIFKKKTGISPLKYRQQNIDRIE